MIRRNRVPSCLLAAAACLAGTGALNAETVRIRSGEHGAFTRLVADTGASEGWAIGRTGGSYELRLAASTQYDLSQAFRLIGRDRIAALAPGTAPGTLRITLGCDCHATAFETPEGALAIDVADGPAPADAPFETPLPPPGTAEGPAPATSDTPPDPLPYPLPQPERTAAAPARTGPLRGFAAAATADPRLALFWRGVGVAQQSAAAASPEPAAAGAEEAPEDPTGSATAEIPARAEAESAASGEAALPASPPAARPIAADPAADPAVTPPAPSRNGSDPTFDPSPSTADPSRSAAPLQLPDAGVIEAQSEILRQLGRAASQGLVEIDLDHASRPGDVPHATAQAPAQAPGASPAGTDPQPRAGSLAVHAETSVDRDTLSVTTRSPATAEGAACLPDEAFDLAAWGDTRPLAIQLADRRTGLVGEFDRPAPEAVRDLARLYLHFGFGAEAQAVLRSFEGAAEGEAVLADVGRILDGRPPGAAASFAGMTGCDTAASLWAVMAWPELPPSADVDDGAVVRAFSALPAHLRRILGPGLSKQLIASGATDAARSVRNAIARTAHDDGAALDLVTARVDLAEGATATGAARLDALARTNHPLSPEALILALETRIARGEAVEPALADSAEALAFEQRDGTNGPVLAALHILARASTGEFDRAFDAWQAWPDTAPQELRTDTAGRLFTMLIEKADDRTFLLHYFDQRAAIDRMPDLLRRLDLADRLAAAGFPGEVRAVLKGEAGYTERGKRLLARAALAEFDAAQAIAQTSGLSDAESLAIQAEAMAMMGDHGAAAERFRTLGDDARAGREAWRAGDTGLASVIGPEPVRAALGTLGRAAPAAAPAGRVTAGPGDPATRGPATPGPAGTAEPAGPIAEGQQLVAKSREAREALLALLDSSGDAAVADPAAPEASAATR